jgi:hypothetical protein
MTLSNVNVNLNQNLWFLIVTLAALGAAEYYNLCTLYWFGLILSSIASISFSITLTAYTINYVKNKSK